MLCPAMICETPSCRSRAASRRVRSTAASNAAQYAASMASFCLESRSSARSFKTIRLISTVSPHMIRRKSWAESISSRQAPAEASAGKAPIPRAQAIPTPMVAAAHATATVRCEQRSEIHNIGPARNKSSRNRSRCHGKTKYRSPNKRKVQAMYACSLAPACARMGSPKPRSRPKATGHKDTAVSVEERQRIATSSGSSG